MKKYRTKIQLTKAMPCIEDEQVIKRSPLRRWFKFDDSLDAEEFDVWWDKQGEKQFKKFLVKREIDEGY